MVRLGGPVGLVFAYGLALALLVQLGYSLKESIAAPAVMWPAAGLAFTALWFAPWRLWPALVATQFAVEMAVAAWWVHPFPVGTVALFTLASPVGAVVGAGLARWQMPFAALRVRARYALWIVVASAVGSLANAMIGAAVNVANFGGGFTVAAWVRDMQLWWGGQWLGCLVIAPLLVFWLNPLRRRFAELALRSRWELALIALVVIGIAIHVFSVTDVRAMTLLQLPTTVVAVVLLAAIRLPPRWSTLLFGLTAVIAAWFISLQRGPFQVDETLLRIGQGQSFLVTLGVISLALSLVMAEKNIAMSRLRDAEYRYRNFVDHSTEAVWRVELARPMPVALRPDEQMAWLRRHALIAEASRSYGQLDPRPLDDEPLPWRSDIGWSAAYEERLYKVAEGGYSVDGLRFTSDWNGGKAHFISSFSGVVENGHLLRIWGVARDITELTELNGRLLREQDRLKTYARQLVTAEEKARRATAVDLHDGIGQSLVGMAMTLDVARQQAPSDVGLLIDEVRSQLRDVQERTRHMISDLSPPGLYELGLEPALQWLAVYMRGKDKLHVELEAGVREECVKLDTRVLVFKLVRELLRNVVKHAGVKAARVVVEGDDRLLRVVVSDQGKGFEWQMDMFGSQAGGFGLWSIADRVHEVGGRFEVDTAPGRGSSFELLFPLMGKPLLAVARRTRPERQRA